MHSATVMSTSHAAGSASTMMVKNYPNISYAQHFHPNRDTDLESGWPSVITKTNSQAGLETLRKESGGNVDKTESI